VKSEGLNYTGTGTQHYSTSVKQKEDKYWNDFISKHYNDNRSDLVKRFWYLGHGAEDVVHDAYERVLRYKDSYLGEDFDRWFNTILYNAMRDYRKFILGRDDDDIDEYSHVGAECKGIDSTLMHEVNKLIQTKNPKHQEVLKLFFELGYSYSDISKVTDNSYFNSYRIVERFKKELKEYFS